MTTNCPNCGGALQLHENVCPYCGTPKKDIFPIAIGEPVTVSFNHKGREYTFKMLLGEITFEPQYEDVIYYSDNVNFQTMRTHYAMEIRMSGTAVTLDDGRSWYFEKQL